MNKSSEKIARIVIVAFKSNNVIQDCLDALSRQSDLRFEVVIVDNGASEDCLVPLSPAKFPLQVITPNANLGFSEGCNLGAKNAATPWLIMLNPDTRVALDWFENLTDSMEVHPETHVWASTLIRDDNPNLLDGFGDVLSIFGMAWRGGYNQPHALAPKKDVLIFGPCGAAAAYMRTAFEAVGGFDATFFCYLEDVDLALRLSLLKHQARISHKAIVQHIGGNSSSQSQFYPIIQTFKNRPYLLIKNLPLWLLVLTGPVYAILQSWIIFRNRKDGFHEARLTGIKESRKLMGQAWRARKKVQQKSGGSSFLWKRLCKSYSKFRANEIFYIGE